MQSKNFFLLVTILIINISQIQFLKAQKNFLPGEIKDQKGNVTKGLIDYKNWNKNPQTIFFKKDHNDTPTKYSTLELLSFRVAEELYESAEIRIETSSRSTANLQKDAKLNFQNTNTFLLTLIEGKKSLYHYKDENLIDHFYIKQNDQFELLIFKRYLKLVNNVLVKAENKKYKNQLAYYLSDHQDIQYKLIDLKYEKKNLTKLFKDYYSATKQEIKNEKSKPQKSHNNFGAIIGFTSTTVNIKGNLHENATTSASINPTLGLFYEVVLPRNNNKWSLQNELLISSYKVDSNIGEIKYSYLKLNNMIRYSHPVSNSHIFFNAGFSNGLALSESNSVNDNNPHNLFPTRKYEQGVLLGLGMKFNNITSEIRYERGNGMIRDNPGLSATTSKLNILMSFKF